MSSSKAIDINETNVLSVNNRNFQSFLQNLDRSSQNPYVRSCERYHLFCTLASLEISDVNSVMEFINFSRHPSSYISPLNEKISFSGTILSQSNAAASTLWAVLSHIKSYFLHCTNRRICDEKPLLNKSIQQWEKTEEQKQVKVCASFVSYKHSIYIYN
jgi:hypothetical protein